MERLALRYVERYATTRDRLRGYLHRKIAERDWDDDAPPPVEEIVARFADAGYVDDRLFAEARAASLARRGYGEHRVVSVLKAYGIDEADGAEARQAATDDALRTALIFARKRRLGPFAKEAPQDTKSYRKSVAAMIRAGHKPDIIRTILSLRSEDIETETNAGPPG